MLFPMYNPGDAKSNPGFLFKVNQTLEIWDAYISFMNYTSNEIIV